MREASAEKDTHTHDDRRNQRYRQSRRHEGCQPEEGRAQGKENRKGRQSHTRADEGSQDGFENQQEGRRPTRREQGREDPGHDRPRQGGHSRRDPEGHRLAGHSVRGFISTAANIGKRPVPPALQHLHYRLLDKRHRAQQGSISVLSGAPYGYRYVKKSDSTAAYYEVIGAEADVVRLVFQTYIEQAASINGITRMLNERQIPTRKGIARWERSTVWAMLRNPAYAGRACFGKTELRPRQRITRPLRQRQGHATRNSANHERPHQDWIEIPVPALVGEATFALAQEQLERNKHHSPRRTVEPSLLQGMLVCEKCGYALYRSSAQTSKQKLYYYRCLGSDAYRYRNGAVCDNRPIRQDYLDAFVWTEMLRLLDDPTLIQAELDRRMEPAKRTDQLRKRGDILQREQVRIQKNIDRLVTAYQESLVTLEQLRQRMPDLRRQEQAVQSELVSLAEAAADQSKYLRLVETLAEFRGRLRLRADSLIVGERQQILRLLVKEILVGKEIVTIRHSIPTRHSGAGPNGSPGPAPVLLTEPSSGSYLLRSGSQVAIAQ